MKFLILFVVFTAVFEANCLAKTIGPDGAPNPDFTDELQKDVGNERNQIELRGKAEKNILKKILKMVEDLNGKVDSLEDVNSNQNTKLDLIIEDIKELSKCQGLVKVNVVSSGGKAYATSTYNNPHVQPINAFDGSAFWHSKDDITLPQTLWVEFPEAIKVVAYSFTSRTNTNVKVEDGPSKYFFWGSNHGDCKDYSKWEILKEDNSGTPFTSDNHPKSEVIINTNSYRCYGFTVTDVPGRNGGGFKVVTIGNVHLYE